MNFELEYEIVINYSIKPCSQYSLLDSLFDETYARLVWVGVFQDWCGLPF